MSSNNTETPGIGSHPFDASTPNLDIDLAIFVVQMNHEQAAMSVTLTVKSMIITGTMIGIKQYYDEMADLVESHQPKSHWADEYRNKGYQLLEDFKERGRAIEAGEPVDDDPFPYFIHLNNASYLFPQENISCEAGLWRGRLSEVDGWSLGSLRAKEWMWTETPTVPGP